MRRHFVLLVMLLAAVTSMVAGNYTIDRVPDTHAVDREQFVSNPDGILSAAAVDSINVRLKQVRRLTSVEAMVVAVDNITPADATTFANDLFTHWGLGKADRDNGLLILIVKDLRQATIRTGYGLEGLLPDITCGRIIRYAMAPDFREGNYSAGTLAAVNVISQILLDPASKDEIMSALADVDDQGRSSDIDGFDLYLIICCLGAGLMLLMLAAALWGLKGKSDVDKYRALDSWRPYYLAGAVAGLGIPLVPALILLLLLNHWRNKRRVCPGCGSVMKKVDEVHDNDYLTPSQDIEERIGSVDYDVWLCPDCGETDIIPYVNRSSPMIECERCHARTARLVRDRILVQPTATRAGRGVKEYECLNCGHHNNRYYEIPATGSAALAGIALGAALGGRGGHGSGGGFSGPIGGGFGGGSTGGGGATGSW